MKTASGRYALVLGLLGLVIVLSMPVSPVVHAAPNYIGCSVPALIGAINAANATAAPDTIELFWGCTYTLTAVDNDNASTGGANGLPVITNDLTINGNHATIERDKNAAAFRILYSQAALQLNDITIRGGSVAGAHENGGGVDAQKTLIVNDSRFEENSATWSGGGVQAAGLNETPHVFTNVTFAGNSAAIGGGVFNGSDSLVTYSGVTFMKNNASMGAGMFSDWHAVTTLGNVTLSNNTGNAIEAQQTAVVNLNNVTIAYQSGYGINIWGPATINLKNTILANNAGGNCSTAMTNGGSNLDSDGSCGVGAATDPKLRATGLNDYGGPTLTIGLAAGSPAIDAGSDTVCNTSPVNKQDQRLVKRPQGGHCDIGAFEAGADLSIQKDATQKNKKLTFSLKVENHGATYAANTVVTDVLAGSLTFTSAKTTQGACSYDSKQRQVRCDLGSVSAGSVIVVTIKTKIAAGTTSVLNQAKVSAKTFDLSNSNNTATVNVKIQ